MRGSMWCDDDTPSLVDLDLADDYGQCVEGWVHQTASPIPAVFFHLLGELLGSRYHRLPEGPVPEINRAQTVILALGLYQELHSPRVAQIPYPRESASAERLTADGSQRASIITPKILSNIYSPRSSTV